MVIFIQEDLRENWMGNTESLPQISTAKWRCTYQSRECLKPKVPLRDQIISIARSSWETVPGKVWTSPFSLKLIFSKKWMKLTTVNWLFDWEFIFKTIDIMQYATGSTFLTYNNPTKNVYIFPNDWFHDSFMPILSLQSVMIGNRNQRSMGYFLF